MPNITTKLISLMSMIFLFAITVVPAVAATPRQQTEKTIVDIAVEDGRFTTLVTALEAANLVDTLNSTGPFTVFAPTDDAFATLPEGTLDSLLADIPTLRNILLYHLVPGRVLAADVVKLSAADTVLGQAVRISVEGNTVKINDAQVIITDIQASNGVIHVIDAVLLPPQDSKPTPAPYYGRKPDDQRPNRYGPDLDRDYNHGRNFNRCDCGTYRYKNSYGHGYDNKPNYYRGHYNQGNYGYNYYRYSYYSYYPYRYKHW